MKTRIYPKKNVAVLGSSSSGKTALITKYVYNRFNSAYKQTIGADNYQSKDNLNLWVVAGGKNLSLAPIYTKKADAIFIVCDISKETWEEDLKNQLKTHRSNIPEDADIFIVGAKKDLIEDVNILKEREQALQKFIADKNMLGQIHPDLANRKIQSATTSAKTGDGIEDLVTTVLKTIHKIENISEIASTEEISIPENYIDKDHADIQQQEKPKPGEDNQLLKLIGKINAISGDHEFWKTKLGSRARSKAELYPSGVKEIDETTPGFYAPSKKVSLSATKKIDEIDAKNTITNLENRLRKIGRHAEWKRSSVLTKWFHTYFRERHPATDEFYEILSRLNNFSQNTVTNVTKELEIFEEKYCPADIQKKKKLTSLIHEILQKGTEANHPMREKFSHSGVQTIKNQSGNSDNFLEATRKLAEKNHSSFPRLHFFFHRIPDPALNEFYGILKELKELDNATVDKTIEKLQKFKKEKIEPPITKMKLL